MNSPSGTLLVSDALTALRSLEPASVAAIVTDPPYGIGYHSNRYQDKNPHAPIAHDWNFQISSVLLEAQRCLKDGGALYLFTRFDVYPLWLRELPPGLSLSNMIVWDKGNHSSGDLTGNFGFQHEIIMFIVKGRHRLRGRRWSNIWSAAKISHTRMRMPAEKPVALYERAVSASSDPGDLVVDPFGGSGTMAEAALTTGRRFLVSDIDPKMVRLARARIGWADDSLEDAPPRPMPVCPIFDAAPASPGLWGVHPEDIADWTARAVVPDDPIVFKARVQR